MAISVQGSAASVANAKAEAAPGRASQMPNEVVNGRAVNARAANPRAIDARAIDAWTVDARTVEARTRARRGDAIVVRTGIVRTGVVPTGPARAGPAVLRGSGCRGMARSPAAAARPSEERSLAADGRFLRRTPTWNALATRRASKGPSA